jgi:hypothetical protein
MTALITVQNSDGVVGRCDAKCYDAKEKGCTCVCGGQNHGAGKPQAVDNTRELADKWVQQARERGQDVTNARRDMETSQEPLFGLKELGRPKEMEMGA